MLHQVVEGGPLDGPISFPRRIHYSRISRPCRSKKLWGRMNVEMDILFSFKIREVLIRLTDVVGAS